MSEFEPEIFIIPETPQQRRQDFFDLLINKYGYDPEDAAALIDEFEADADVEANTADAA